MIDVAGGEGGITSGGGDGGGGAAGRVRVDLSSGDVPAGAWRAPAVDLGTVTVLTDTTHQTWTGRAAPDAAVIAEVVSAETHAVEGTFTATADGTGAFSIEVDLLPGLNRVRILADTPDGPVRSWVGNSFEFDEVAGSLNPLPVGAVIDVAVVPDAE
jgi:hypothetical protein